MDTDLAGPTGPSANLSERGDADRKANPGLCVQAVSKASLQSRLSTQAAEPARRFPSPSHNPSPHSGHQPGLLARHKFLQLVVQLLFQRPAPGPHTDPPILPLRYLQIMLISQAFSATTSGGQPWQRPGVQRGNQGRKRRAQQQTGWKNTGPETRGSRQ